MWASFCARVFIAGVCRIAHAGESWLLLSHQRSNSPCQRIVSTLGSSISRGYHWSVPGDALIYLDQAMASIDKVTPEGATVMHQVSADEALHGVRILSIDSR